MTRTQKEQVLHALRCGPRTTMQLIQLGICCPTRRIFELRQDGYEIELTERWQGKKRICTYTLKGQLSLRLEDVA